MQTHPSQNRTNRAWMKGALVAVLWALAPTLLRYARAMWLLLALLGQPVPRFIEGALTSSVEVTEIEVTELHGLDGARLYQPRSASHGMGIVLLHGVHPDGMREKRLSEMARALAAIGHTVLTPQLDELADFRVDESTAQKITRSAERLAALLHTPRVHVIGISFAGGLALMAAASQAGERVIARVTTVGAHDDLMRLARHYAHATVLGPHGEATQGTPHPYGPLALIATHTDAVFSTADAITASRALRAYLASDYAKAKLLSSQLTTAGQRTYVTLTSRGLSDERDKLLLTSTEAHREALERASPKGHLGRLRVPVALLHGRDDPIIPSVESLWLAEEIPAAYLRTLLISPILRHAELPNPAGLRDNWNLLHFVAQMIQ